MRRENKCSNEIAIVGISCMLPQAKEADELWENIVGKKDCIVEISKEKWNESNFFDSNIDSQNKISSKWIGEVSALKEFDNKFFSISPAEADNMDPDQRALLQETWKCIEDSGISLKTLRDKRTSVIVGTAEVDTFENQHMPGNEINEFSGKGLFLFMIANRISWYFGFSGESKLVETGCPSGMCALNDGVNLLKLGKSDFAIVSGINTFKTSHMLKLMSKNGLFSPDGKCKTFSADANGIVVSEGVVSLLLAPLSVAKENKCHIYGIIENTAVSHSGETFSITAPKLSAQKDLILDAWRGLKFSPDTINYIETHGTGTSLGDPIEIEALKQAYEQVTEKKHFCWLGSVKPNIGHSLPVSGLAGIVKVLKMFEYGVIPGQINISEINPLINIEDSPFNITTENVSWQPDEKKLPLRAGVTSLGFAGVNAHVVLEQYIEPKNESDTCVSEPLKKYPIVLSAKSEEALIQLLEKWEKKIKKLESNSIKDIAFTLCSGREQFKYRTACVVEEGSKLIDCLVGLKEDIREVSDKKYLLDISFIDEMFINRIVEIVRNNACFETELSAVTERLNISKDQAYNPEYYPSEYIFNLIIATAYIKGLLSIADNLEGIYLKTEDKKLLALMIAEVINIEDVISYLDNKENAKNIITDKPKIIVNFNNETLLTKEVITDKYITCLLAELSLEFKQSDISKTAASTQWLNNIRLLYKNQRTFSKFIHEVNKYIEYDDFDLVKFISAEENNLDDINDNRLKFTVLIAVNIAIKRLYKKWSLVPPNVFADDRLNEISDLVINGYFTFKEICGLYQKESSKKWQGPCNHTLEDILLLEDSNGITACDKYSIFTGLKEKNTMEEILVDMWLTGANIDWKKGLAFNKCKLVSLPTYCFNKKTFKYIKQDIIECESEQDELQVKVLDYTPSSLEVIDSEKQRLLVFSNLEQSNFEYLAAKELVYVKVSASKKAEKGQYSVQPELLEDSFYIFNKLEQIGYVPDVILVALNDSEEIRETEDYVLSTFIFATNLAKCLIQKNKFSGKLLFSSMGNESRMYSEGLTAFFKTLHIEYENLCFRNITCYEQTTSDFISVLNKEINYFSSSEYKVTYRKLQRTVQAYTDYQPETQIPYLKENGTYILLGGFGEIGKVIAQHLAAQANVNLILCGRKPENDEIRKFINPLNQRSTRVVYKSVDVSIKEQLQELINNVTNEFGTINGIFNMTGYIDPGFLESKDNEFLRNGVRLKVDATVFLDEITKDINLDFFVNFSSVSALVGDFGLSEYVYANCFFDEFIRHREKLRKEGKRSGNSISINWPYWQDGGLRMVEKDASRFSSTTGLSPLLNKDAIIAFDNIMKSNMSLQCCVLFGKDKKMNEYLESKLRLPIILQNNNNVTFDNSSDIDVKTIVEQYLTKVIAKELNLSIDDIDLEDAFQSMGIDSILIHKLNRILLADFSGVSSTIFFDCKNIDEMAAYFVQTYSEEQIRSILVPNGNYSIETVTSCGCAKASSSLINEQTLDNEFQITDSVECESKDIAIIGMSGRFPMAKSIEEFWMNLISKKDCISAIPETRWNVENFYDNEAKNAYKGKMYSRWGGFIDDVDQFDPMLFQISPLDAGNMDPQERILLEVVYEAFEYAGYSKQRIQEKVKGNVGVFIGNTTNGYRLLIEDEMAKGNFGTHQALPWSIANRVSYVFELNGPSFIIDSACSSSLNSIVTAVDNIRNGKCKMAIAGGVNLHIHPSEYVLRSQLRVLSPRGKCHSFGSEADGYVPGEGIGAIILKPLRDAERDGDNILGIIKGVASNHVGHPNGYTVPSSTSQATVIKAAIDDAGISAREITFIEAHGTGTILGDPIEINGLKSAFSNYTEDNQFCAIGSVKSNIGHLEGAAGIVSTIKSVLQLMNKVKIPLLNCDTPNPRISFADSQFYLQKELEPWTTYNNKLVLGISSFGAGGSNAHILIQNHENNRKRSQTRGISQVPVLISAMTDDGVRKYVQKMLNWLEEQEEKKNTLDISDIAYTTQVGRELLDSRICVLCSSVKELKASLMNFLNDKPCSSVKTHMSTDKNTITKSQKNKYATMAQAAVNAGNVEEVAEFAVMGIKIDWEQFNILQHGFVIMLPTYVFDNQRYWLNFEENSDKDTDLYIKNKLAFLIDANISTIENQRFTRTIHSDEFFIKDHVIDGQALLPGTAIIEMAMEAGNLSLPNHRINAIEDIQFHKAIEVSEEAVELQIDIIPEDYCIRFKIYNCKEDERILSAEGKLIIDTDTNNTFEIPLIEGLVEADSEEYYTWLDTLGFNFKNSFKSIEKLFVGQDLVMSVVSITQREQFEGRGKNCTLWPPLFDGVLQSTFKLVENHTEKGCLSLPVSIGKLIMHGSTRGNLIALAQKSKNCREENGEFIFDIYILNENGKLVMEVQEYRLVNVKKANHVSEKYDDTDDLIQEVIRRIKNGEIDKKMLLNLKLLE